jgi:ferredoxin
VNETCIGCSACVAISPEAFELDDEGKSVVINCPSYDKESIEDSISACPVDAITWEK